MQRWEDEEKDLDEMKRQYREALRKVCSARDPLQASPHLLLQLYERRDMLEPCERLFSHLDRLYEQLFGSLKLGESKPADRMTDMFVHTIYHADRVPTRRTT